MKYLLLFLVVFFIAWRWKTTRTALERKAQQKQAAAPAALAMVRCQQCGVHVPANDALTGAQGSYCSAAHRCLAEP